MIATDQRSNTVDATAQQQDSMFRLTARRFHSSTITWYASSVDEMQRFERLLRQDMGMGRYTVKVEAL